MRRFLAIILGAASALLPALALADAPNPTSIDPCPMAGILTCLVGGDLATYFNDTIIAGARIAFIGLLIGAVIYYGLKLLFAPESDNAATEAKQAFEYALLGVILMTGASLLAQSFVTGGVAEPSGVNTVLDTIVVFIKAVIAVALLVNISIQGFQMIVSTEEGGVTKARTRFLHAIFGAAIVLLTSPIVNMMYQRNASAGEIELKGIANFLITIFGILAVVALIVSGILLVISVDESFKDRAKKLATASLVALVVVICAAAFVNFFIITPA